MSADSLSLFDPLVAEWFRERHGAPTDIQTRAWQTISRGTHLLLTAPTGSGKTMAAFLWALDQWITARWQTGCTRVLYVSPLKALNNDIQRNVLAPLAELQALFTRRGRRFPEIRVQTRSGDTPASERRRMVRRPPEILITTPESLNLLLSSASGRAILGNLQTVILDEIHAILSTRRGTYLITAIERLVRLSGEFQRIALSATIQPLAAAASFVGGFRQTGHRSTPVFEARPVCVLAPRAAKKYDLTVRLLDEPESPRDPNDFWNAFAEHIRTHLRTNRSTLIFANSRRLCEKLTFMINRLHGELIAYAHHGSLAKEIRAEVENNLKHGRLKAIVATGSLELGIDVGALDEVILVQTPWSVSEAVQRVGRAGHGVGQTSRGTFLPSHIADKIAAIVTARAIVEGDIEPAFALRAPLDVLAQVLVSMLAFEAWHPDDLYNVIRTAAPYRDLTRRQFDLVIDMLEGRFEDSRIRELQPKISHDRLDRRLTARKGALQALYASGGVIPDRGYYALRHAHTSAKIGELDEEFVWEARVGQEFTLGAQNWRIRRITHSDVQVLPAAPGKPVPPFWRAEQNQRGNHMAEKIGQFLERAEAGLHDATFLSELEHSFVLNSVDARRLLEDLAQQRTHTGTALPHRHHLLLEETTLGAGRAAGRQLICHTLWGGRVNRPLAVALEAAWIERFGSTPQIFCTNDTITFLLPPDLRGEDLFNLVHTETLHALLHRRLAQTGFFGARFRECAGRALLLPRRQINQRMPLWLTRLRAQKLLTAVAPYSDFPILVETWRTCLQDEFDLPRLQLLLQELENGIITRSYVRTPFPSPMARAATWQQVNYLMYQDDRPAPDRGGRLRPDLLQEVTLDPGLRPNIDADLVQRFEEKRQRLATGYAPDAPEELLDWLKERIALPWSEWQALLQAAVRDHALDEKDLVGPVSPKIVLLKTAMHPQSKLVVTRELLPRILENFYGDASDRPSLAFLDGEPVPIPPLPKRRSRAVSAELLGEWLRFYGPRPVETISEELGIALPRLSPAIEDLAAAQTIIVGQLIRDRGTDDLCDQENFESLLRLARKSFAPTVEALPIERLPLFLASYQGIAPLDQTEEDLPLRLNQLLCLPASAAAWETEILPARLSDYRPEWFDRLMQSSTLRWIGNNGHKILFCFEEEFDLIGDEESSGKSAPESDSISKKISNQNDLSDFFPEGYGRYPFSALERMSQMSATVLNERLWQAVWQGTVSNDTLSALRRGIQIGFKMPEHATARPARGTHRQSRAMFDRWRGARPSIGNWFRIEYPVPAVTNDLIEREERRKERVRLLLDRYGILFRELLVRELPVLRWAALFRSLRLMELSGEVLAGHFFDSIEGLQFISPKALRHLQHPLPDDAVYWLNATDPASVCGLGITPLQNTLPKRLSGGHLVYHGAAPVIISHQFGRRLDIRVPADHPRLGDYFRFLDHLLTRAFMPLRSVRIQSINGLPAATQSAYISVLQALFETLPDDNALLLYRRHIS